MIHSKKFLVIALAAPIVALFLIAAQKQFVRTRGKEVTLPISGFDPRDLLSGHYVTYRINYSITERCSDVVGDTENTEAFVCLEPKRYFMSSPESDCTLFLRGQCSGGRFETGLEKFYIEENQEYLANSLVREGKASIVLSVTSNGTAIAKDLLIEGRSIRKMPGEK